MNKIAIHSVPRSGSSWLGEIINSSPDVNYAYQPLFSYEFKSRLDENSSLTDINKLYQEISRSEDEFIRQSADRLSGKKPLFMKNEVLPAIAYKEVRYHYILDNLLKKDLEIKIIGLVRNPISVINSWYNAPREFRKDLGWQLSQELMDADKKNQDRKEDYFGLNKWIETTLIFEYLKIAFPDRFMLVQYEELCLDTLTQVKNIFDFIGLEYGMQTADFLNQKSTVKGTYSVIKNKNSLNEINLDFSIIEEIKNKINHCHLDKYITQIG